MSKRPGDFVISEKDGSGHIIAWYTSAGISQHRYDQHARIRNVTPAQRFGMRWRQILNDVFLPEGYPATVSDGELNEYADYLQYQIWNALQAFCSSLASLFASRAVLQAHGVGNASASATNAILLTVLQDVFSRLTTIVSGYYLGTSLYPEAKTYRLLADIFNDVAIILDTLSPYLATISLSHHYPYVVPTTDSPLRILALCLSGASRAICGAVAGGSKAALTVHFATAGEKPGDVGDLSAKDGSKETVLALLGMLCGTVVVQYVHGHAETYAVLFTLIFFHLAANVMAVRVISMRSFNRQRASIAWKAYRASVNAHEGHMSKVAVLPHQAVSKRERIFTDSSWIVYDKNLPARCFLGVPLATIRGPCTHLEGTIPLLSTSSHLRHDILSDDQIFALLETFVDEKYILWYASAPSAAVRLVVGLKEGNGPRDHLKAWLHAHEVVQMCRSRTPSEYKTQLEAVRDASRSVRETLSSFVEAAMTAGWKVDEGALVGGSPTTISVELGEGPLEDRKNV